MHRPRSSVQTIQPKRCCRGELCSPATQATPSMLRIATPPWRGRRARAVNQVIHENARKIVLHPVGASLSIHELTVEAVYNTAMQYLDSKVEELEEIRREMEKWRALYEYNL